MEPLLRKISDIIPDEKIDRELTFPLPERGPHSSLRPSQLYRIHLLFCLKRLASFRQLQADLGHHREWRSFAHLKNKNQVPSLDVMSRFRQKGVPLLRQINQSFLSMIIATIGRPSVVVAVPDSTDIEAATRGYAKKTADALGLAITHDFIPQKMQQKDIVPKNLDRLHSSLATRNTHCASFFSISPSLGTSPLQPSSNPPMRAMAMF